MHWKRLKKLVSFLPQQVGFWSTGDPRQERNRPAPLFFDQISNMGLDSRQGFYRGKICDLFDLFFCFRGMIGLLKIAN